MNPRPALLAWQAWAAGLGGDPFDAVRAPLARALGSRNWDELPQRALETCRLFLVDPQRSRSELGPVFTMIEVLVHDLKTWSDVPPAGLLALTDLVNAFGSIGTPLPHIVEVFARSWLPDLLAAGLTGSARTRLGLAALALNDLVIARAVAGIQSIESVEIDYAKELSDLDGTLRNFVIELSATRMPKLYAQGFTVIPFLSTVFENLPALLATGHVDEPALLWMGRLVYRDVMQQAPGTVVGSTRELLDATIRRVTAYEEERTRAADAPPAFPHGETLGGGVIRIEEHLQGTGFQQLWRGRRVADGREVLVAMDTMSSRADLDGLRAAVSSPGAAGADLVHVGLGDRSTAERAWFVADAPPRGTWLPRALPARPGAAIARELGISAGRLALQAARSGQLLVRARPEYMWGVEDAGRWQVTAITDRPDALFARKGYEMFTHPLFDRSYAAPEHATAPTERSAVYTLAVMIAEWAGRFPLPSIYADYGLAQRERVPIEAPPQLRALLERAIQDDPAARPDLQTFVDELAALTPGA